MSSSSLGAVGRRCRAPCFPWHKIADPHIPSDNTTKPFSYWLSGEIITGSQSICFQKRILKLFTSSITNRDIPTAITENMKFHHLLKSNQTWYLKKLWEVKCDRRTELPSIHFLLLIQNLQLRRSVRKLLLLTDNDFQVIWGFPPGIP